MTYGNKNKDNQNNNHSWSSSEQPLLQHYRKDRTTTATTTTTTTLIDATNYNEKKNKKHYYYRNYNSIMSSSKGEQSKSKSQSQCCHGEEQEHEHEHEHGREEVTTRLREDLPFKVYLYAFCAALNSCNLGYDIGVSTNTGPLIQSSFDLSNTQLELFLGSINFFSIFGALLSPFVTDIFGRRMTFCWAALGFILGMTMMATAQNFTTLLLARAIVGVGVGIGEAIDPMYISEIAPPSHRGELVSWAEAGVAVGVVLGFMSSFVVWPVRNDPTVEEWRIMLALGCILPFIMLLLVWKVMPESPRWLITNHRPAEAKVILEETYPATTNVNQIMTDITESLEMEQLASTAVGWTALICRPTPAIRRMLLVGIGIAIIQQACGIDSVMFYLLFVISRSGITSDLWQLVALIALGMVKLLFVFVGAKLFDRVGRRQMLFTSLLGCAASLIVVSFTFKIDTQASEIVCILALACFLAFFSIGLGPGNWVVVSEVFATSIRAKAMSLAIFPNRVTATIMASTFLSMAHVMTWPGFFLFLAFICIMSCLFLYIYLPETKGKSLEQMAVYFAEITGDRSILDVEEKLRQRKQQKRDVYLMKDEFKENDNNENDNHDGDRRNNDVHDGERTSLQGTMA